MKTEKIAKAIDGMQEFATRVTSDLVRFPTQNPSGEHYTECVGYLERFLQDMGLKTQVVTVSGEESRRLAPSGQGLDRPNLIGKWEGRTGKPTLHLNGHYDVVPTGGSWEITKPFEPVTKNGRIYGRGACDMKGGLASILLAIKALKDADVAFEGTLTVSATADEETGGKAGLGYLTEKGYLNGTDYALIPEPTVPGTFSPAHKGDLWVEIEVTGKAAHGSAPFLGVNAFLKAAKLAVVLEKELNDLFLKNGPSKFPVDQPRYGYPTVTIGGETRGRNKANTVPDVFTFTMDRRVIPEERFERVYEEIEQIAERFRSEDKGVRVELKKLLWIPPAQTPIESPICNSMKKVLRETLGVSPKLTLAPYFTDMHYLTDLGVHAVVFGPGRIEQAHVADEYCVVSDILDVAKVIAGLTLDLLKAQY
jgi:succinyl-diaminopimelate desuccinylase